MMYFFYGTDRAKVQAAAKALAKKMKLNVVRVTDSNSFSDVEVMLRGRGMFDEERIVVLEGIVGGENEEMRSYLLDSLDSMKKSKEIYVVIEGALLAEERKQIEKYAETSEKFESPKKEKDNSVFALAGALKRGDKKGLWVLYQSELAHGKAPEALLGILFWGAKDMITRGRSAAEKEKGQQLVRKLAELPHAARRAGEEMEYALERFVLSGV